MKGKKSLSEGIVQVTMVVTLALFMGLMPACSKSIPPCNSPKAVDSVVNSAAQRLRKEFSRAAALGGAQISDEQWKSIRSDMALHVENISEKGFDENTGIRTCSGTLAMTVGSKMARTPIEYSIELNKSSGELETTISSGFPGKPRAHQ